MKVKSPEHFDSIHVKCFSPLFIRYLWSSVVRISNFIKAILKKRCRLLFIFKHFPPEVGKNIIGTMCCFESFLRFQN